jgi:hypothetical protein
MRLSRRGEKYVYQPLLAPKLHRVPLPDFRVMQNAPFISSIAEEAKALLSGLGPAGMETRFPGLGRLRVELLDAFADGRETMKPSIGAAISYSLGVGWAVGDLENQSGVAKTRSSEGHYWSAMVLLSTAGDHEGSEEFLEEAGFSLWAAYYVARAGNQSIGEVVAASKTDRPRADHSEVSLPELSEQAAPGWIEVLGTTTSWEGVFDSHNALIFRANKGLAPCPGSVAWSQVNWVRLAPLSGLAPAVAEARSLILAGSGDGNVLYGSLTRPRASGREMFGLVGTAMRSGAEWLEVFRIAGVKIKP